MQTRHLFLVDEQDGQVGIRREVEPIEQVRRLRLDARVIDPGNARGVVDIDGHGSRPARAAMRRGGAQAHGGVVASVRLDDLPHEAMTDHVG